MTVMADLYDNNINMQISSFWGCGFLVKLGNVINGFVAGAVVPTWDDVERWSVATAMEHYPNSPFTEFYRTRLEDFHLDMGHVRELLAAELANVGDPLAAEPLISLGQRL